MSIESRFPLLIQNARRPARVVEYIETIERGYEAGEIGNKTYNDARSGINGALDSAWKVVQNIYLSGDRNDSLQQDLYYQSPMLHALNATKRKAEAVAQAEMGKAALALIAEVEPLAVMIKDLKGKVVKRQPKPADERVEAYKAPMASKSAVAQVQKLLFELTDSAHEKLVANFVGHYRGMLDHFLTCSRSYKPTRRDPVLTPYQHSVIKEGRYTGVNEKLYVLLSELTEQVGASYMSPKPYTAKADADERILVMAKKTADEIREQFVAKNLMKLDSILEAKGDFASAEIVGREVSLGGLQGTLRFTFKDGASFMTKIQVVYVVNHYGTEFFRTPITFHDVVLGNGSKMKGPSEKKMNTVFVGKK